MDLSAVQQELGEENKSNISNPFEYAQNKQKPIPHILQ